MVSSFLSRFCSEGSQQCVSAISIYIPSCRWSWVECNILPAGGAEVDSDKLCVVLYVCCWNTVQLLTKLPQRRAYLVGDFGGPCFLGCNALPVPAPRRSDSLENN